MLDYVTGYELRLGSLYLLPIALATWNVGRSAGTLIAAIACLCWLVSFNSNHSYARPILFYWDGLVMAITFAAFILLLARLHLALNRADERFIRLIGELRTGVYVVDQNSGKTIYANQRLAQMIDADPLKLSGKDLHRFFVGNDEEPPAIEAATQPEKSPGFSAKERLNPATGRWYLMQSGTIPWRGGQTATLKVVTDITDRRHAQSLRRENQDMLKRTARLSELAETTSTLAHEINQPLMAIASYNDACLRLFDGGTPNPDELMHALEKSRAQALRAGDIVTRMRNTVRSKKPQPVMCDLNGILLEALELIETRTEEDSVVTNTRLADNLPNILADRFLLVQVAVNLLENAVDAMRPQPPTQRRITISTRLLPDEMIEVSIADRGVGISEAIGENLFTPFHTTKPHGLGLGLSICRSVVEAHGGRLWHTPNPDGGTIFQFTVAIEAA